MTRVESAKAAVSTTTQCRHRGQSDSLFLHDFQDTGDCFANVGLQFVNRFPLRITARESGHLSPKPAFGVLMDYNGVRLHALIFA
jgi:hypothetical protein